MGSIVPLAALVLAGWALWQLASFVRTYLSTAHLRRIRGPQATSVLTGELAGRLVADHRLMEAFCRQSQRVLLEGCCGISAAPCPPVWLGDQIERVPRRAYMLLVHVALSYQPY